jgi:hypothetical protein
VCNSKREIERREREREREKPMVRENTSQGGKRKIDRENYCVRLEDDMFFSGGIVHQLK